MTPMKALVTGAGRGIGRSIALRLAQEGFEVALLARTESELDAVQREIEGLGARAMAIHADVGSSPSVAAGVSRALAAFDGKLDMLVNNAGVFEILPFWEGGSDLWERSFQVNLMGAMRVTKAALPGLRSSDKAHVFNMASTAARQGYAGSSVYCAMKAGLMGFSNGLREDLRPEGIRVSTIYPGTTDTAIFDHVPGEWDRSTMNQPEDVAEVLWTGWQSEGDAADLWVPPPNP